ncbi:response regulator transcription factor [Streptomyces sp. NPDC101118]|uniref:response regulator transcription factor n=1 Tax=Streptomyces sp. NPDC101118 TaxID=3366109 RepID=UPI0037FB341E
MGQVPLSVVQTPLPLQRGGEPRPSESWRVLVIDSRQRDAQALGDRLRRHGHEVWTSGTGGSALESYGDASLVLLELELPDLDGLEVCRQIRAASDVPVIVVTSRGSELDRVLGLQAGADDYLVKPYGFQELMARMDAVMRRVKPQPLAPESIEHGRLRIDVAAREVTLDDEPVELSRKEFDLLHVLAAHPEAIVPRRQLMNRVWGGSRSRRTVDTHVSSLRTKLGSRDWVITVRGVGFRIGNVNTS